MCPVSGVLAIHTLLNLSTLTYLTLALSLIPNMRARPTLFAIELRSD